MSADGQSGDENALQPFWQQAAVGDVGGHDLAVRWLEHEHGVNGKAMGVEIAARLDDRVGEGAPEVGVDRREEEITDDLPALPGVCQLGEIVAIPEFFSTDQEGTPRIDDVNIVDEGVVRVGIACAQIPVGQSRPLQGDVFTGRIDTVGPGRGSDVRAAGRVDHNLGQNDAPSGIGGYDDAFDTIVIDEGAAAQRPVPDISAGLAQLLAIPLDFQLVVPGLSLTAASFGRATQFGQALVDLFGEAFAIAIIVLADQAHRADAA